MQKLDVGATLSKSISIFFRGLPTLLGIAIPVYAPYLYLQAVHPGELDEFTGLRQDNPYAFVLSLFLGPFVTAAATYEVLQRLRGATAGVGECLLVGLRRLFPVLAVSVLSWLAMFLGLILLIIPGIIMYVMLSVAIPVCVVERPGIFRSLERSFDLTRGSRWAIFAVLLVFGLLGGMGPALLVGISMGANAGGYEGVGEVARWLIIASTVLLGVLQAVISATMYHELRVRKEGAQSDDLVQVFA
jgi:hypothetical protein